MLRAAGRLMEVKRFRKKGHRITILYVGQFWRLVERRQERPR
jgi:hypothetical protein